MRRFIPTPAGNPFILRSLARRHSVHPHTRGEPIRCGMLFSCRNGSSPHPRGTHEIPRFFMSSLRFIPTPAGNPRALSACRAQNPVHPHTRGEPVPHKFFNFSHVGSSPHPRGTRAREALTEMGVRFIPTPAGNPLAIET